MVMQAMIINMHLISEREEDDAHSYIKRPSKNMLQEKCYKNNRDGLRHQSRGSIRDINDAFQ